jgi:hypothetical protein
VTKPIRAARFVVPLLFILLVPIAAEHVLQATQVRSVPPQSVTPSLDAQVQGLAPHDLVQSLANRGDLQVQALPADLDGSGKYDYVIATYVSPLAGGDMLVLRNVGSQLQVVGRLSPNADPGLDNGSRIKLVYVDNSGSPAIEVDTTSADGMNVTVGLLRWTGTQLVSLLPQDTILTNAYFFDPTGTGVPEIVNPEQCLPSGSCNGIWQIYALKNNLYSLVASSTADPSELTPPDGEDLPLPGVVTAEPSSFGAADILATTTKNQGADVLVKLGNLAPLNSRSSSTDVSEVDLASIYAGRNLHPTSVQIIGAVRGKAEGFDGSFLEITLPRSGVIQYLAKAQMTKPPMPGDAVSLPVFARLKSGLALYGSVSLSITGAAAQ